MKCGTTSLYYDICEHPCTIAAAYDEIGFFDENFHLGLNWYRSMFPTKFLKKKIAKRFGKSLTYDVTPSYIWKPWVARRIKELFPGIKLIAILRNPVDKAYSHYHLAIRSNNEKLTFEEAVMRDMKTFSDLVNSDSKINDDYFKNQINCRSFSIRTSYSNNI